MIGEEVNIISKFLAIRDIEKLNKEEIYKKYAVEKIDILILVGNGLLYTAQVAADVYKQGLCRKLMLTGGIGHSTDILRNNVRQDARFRNIEVEGKPEAEIFLSILADYYKIPEEDIIIENKSTTCGTNAAESLKVIKEIGLSHKTIMIVQDPTMQLRTYAAFVMHWRMENTEIINYSPFIPVLDENENIKATDDVYIDGLWNKERFLSLIMGEIPRLIDDENGYGPNGKNFIAHVDVPVEILNAYNDLKEQLKDYIGLR